MATTDLSPEALERARQIGRSIAAQIQPEQWERVARVLRNPGQSDTGKAAA